jgi:hypothetical protein
MKKIIFSTIPFLLAVILIFSKCSGTASADMKNEAFTNGGYETQVKWGEHLVAISGCTDCHTPKKMTDHGPVPDDELFLSGRPSGNPSIDVNRKEMQQKGLAVTQDLTEWVGPWGVSYAANLTPDETGILNWKEEQFLRAIKEGKYKGLPDARTLLPPMPWEQMGNMTDDELKAIFSYLKTIKPIKNLVPQVLPPEAP